MTKRLSNLDMNQNQILQALAQVLGSDPGSPVAGQYWYNSSGGGTLRFRNGSSNIILGTLDQISAPGADVSLNSHKITNLTAGSNPSDAVNLTQLQDAIAGLNWKDSVRAASTSNVTLASAVENGDSFGGVTLATGNRVALLGQTAGAENGIYTVNASGAPTRATDADSASDIQAASFYVEEGTNAGTLWTLSTDPPITLGTTSLTFAQFGGGSSYTGGAGLTLTGNDFAVNVGGGIEISGDTVQLTVPVTVARGGTGATDAAGAKTNLGFTSKYTASIGNGSSTSIAVTHNLGTRAVVVSVHDATTFEEYECDVTKTDTNNVTLGFAVAPSSNGLIVTVIG